MTLGDFKEVFVALWNLIVYILIQETGYEAGADYYR